MCRRNRNGASSAQRGVYVAFRQLVVVGQASLTFVLPPLMAGVGGVAGHLAGDLIVVNALLGTGARARACVSVCVRVWVRWELCWLGILYHLPTSEHWHPLSPALCNAAASGTALISVFGMRTVSAWSTFAGLAGVVLQCRLVELAADAGAISGLVHLIAIAVLVGGTVGVVAIGFPQGIRLSVVLCGGSGHLEYWEAALNCPCMGADG